MSCGIPVITTQYYPANDNNAWLTKPKSVEAIVEKFDMAYNATAMKATKIEHALKDVQQFKWELVGEKLNGFLKEFKNRLS